jgi:hypothetical protein
MIKFSMIQQQLISQLWDIVKLIATGMALSYIAIEILDSLYG